MTSLKDMLFFSLSTEVGRGPEGQKEYVLRYLREDAADSREELESDIRRIFGDPATNWNELMSNDMYTVDQYMNEDQAKRFIIENICKPLRICADLG